MKTIGALIPAVLLSLAPVRVFAQDIWTEIICPSFVMSEDVMTLSVSFRNSDMAICREISGSFRVLLSEGSIDVDSIDVYLGRGSLTTVLHASEDFTVAIEGFAGEKAIHVAVNPVAVDLSGIIQSSMTLGSDTIFRITDDLTIAQGAVLTLTEGCRVMPGKNVNIIAEGVILSEGTPEAPVIFCSQNIGEPWGGIVMKNGQAVSEFRYTVLTNGGNNADFVFGHSGSQPVLMADHTSLILENVIVADNPGKAIGGSHSIVQMTACLFSRCDTGGEYHFCHVENTGSYYIDMPVNDDIPADDDNDGSYFYNVHPDAGGSVIKGCVFVNGKDDGIDHNDALLEIIDCWIEGFDNEGIAASSGHSVNVYNTLVKGCGQGIEAGYGNPEVVIDHCVLIENGTGLRFGDSYDWGCEGHITASNSIFFGNDDNIRNFDLLTQEPVPGAIDVSYSITNDPEYDAYPYCFASDPLFAENYLLLDGSPGKAAASDGSDIGLVTTLLPSNAEIEAAYQDVHVFPNPVSCNGSLFISLFDKRIQLLQIMDPAGIIVKQIDLKGYNNQFIGFSLSENNLKPGLYLLRVIKDNSLLSIKKLIIL